MKSRLFCVLMLLVVLTGCAVNRTVSKENVFSSNINPAIEIEVEFGLRAQPVVVFYTRDNNSSSEVKITIYPFVELNEEGTIKRAIYIRFDELQRGTAYWLNDGRAYYNYAKLAGHKFTVYTPYFKKSLDDNAKKLGMNINIVYARVSWRKITGSNTIIAIDYVEPLPQSLDDGRFTGATVKFNDVQKAWWKELRARGERTFKVVK